MSSKKDETEGQLKESTPAQDSMPKDWRPDYFPTSAKPVFLKVSSLFIGILILCLFLGYCSESENSRNKNIENSNSNNPNPENEADSNDANIFE